MLELYGRLEQLGVLVLGRVAGCPDDQIVFTVVDGLERRARVDAEHPTGRHLHAHWRLVEVHRKRACEDDERLLLDRVPVTTAFRAGLVAPYVAPHVGKTHALAQLCDVTRRLAGLVRAGDPAEIAWPCNAVAHTATLAIVLEQIRGPAVTDSSF